jgi:uncharacterized membrane protein YvlD (DUF360 family)
MHSSWHVVPPIGVDGLYRGAMPAFALAWLLGLAANAIALLVCWLVLPGFGITPVGLVVAVILFAVFSAVFSWAVMKLLQDQGSAVVALTGVISTFLALVLTATFTPGLTIDGLGTWVIATVIIWLISVVIWVIPGPWRNVRSKREAKD